MKKLYQIVLTVFTAVGMLLPSSFANPNAKNFNESSNEVSYYSGNCISGVFIAREDGHIVGTITLNSNCTFKIVDSSDGYVTTTTGTYSIDGSVSRGQMADINFYVDGSSAGSARIAWPEDEGLCILLNGYVFRKQ